MADIVSHPTSNALNSGAPQTDGNGMPSQSGNALAMANGPQGMPMGPAQQPAPSHEQAVAALIHFERLSQDFGKLLADPEIGKKDMKRDIYDMAAGLLGEGFSTLPSLMGELQTIPKDPPDQYKWIKQHADNAQMAAAKVFRDYRAANRGSGDWVADGAALQKHSMANHSKIMSGVTSHYKGRARA